MATVPTFDEAVLEAMCKVLADIDRLRHPRSEEREQVMVTPPAIRLVEVDSQIMRRAEWHPFNRSSLFHAESLPLHSAMAERLRASSQHRRVSPPMKRREDDDVVRSVREVDAVGERRHHSAPEAEGSSEDCWVLGDAREDRIQGSEETVPEARGSVLVPDIGRLDLRSRFRS